MQTNEQVVLEQTEMLFFQDLKNRLQHTQRGLTLIEIVLVIAIFAFVIGIVGTRLGGFALWRTEATLRDFSELFAFLHRQAVTDQVFYRFELNIDDGAYRVGVLRPESDVNDQNAEDNLSEIGNLSREMIDFINPSVEDSQTLIPPPSYPSLIEPKYLPSDLKVTDVRTTEEKVERGQSRIAFIVFSPRGFNGFAVIHLRTSAGGDITLFPNPYTGITEIEKVYKDYQWSGRQKTEG